MNIDLIIEALETALKMEWLCEPCEYQCISAGDKCQVDKKIKAAIAEALKMQEPCVWKRVNGRVQTQDCLKGHMGFSKTEYCASCGRKVKYE